MCLDGWITSASKASTAEEQTVSSCRQSCRSFAGGGIRLTSPPVRENRAFQPHLRCIWLPQSTQVHSVCPRFGRVSRRLFASPSGQIMASLTTLIEFYGVAIPLVIHRTRQHPSLQRISRPTAPDCAELERIRCREGELLRMLSIIGVELL